MKHEKKRDMDMEKKMNVLFLSLIDIETIEERNIYMDLLREFRKNGHKLFIISPTERRNNQRTHFIRESAAVILKLKIGNIQKSNIIEKGISTVQVEYQCVNAIKKYFAGIRFDLVLYPTPPITFYSAINYVKRRDKAKTYLLLKDIFPQNAVDLGILSKTGIKGALYHYFRKKEKKLYRISDTIGCMSEANVGYVLKHNPEVDGSKVEVCPNCVEPGDISADSHVRKAVRRKHGIPQDRIIFIYGGNLGKPQGIGFMLRCLHSQRENQDIYFWIVGNGTEYGRIKNYIEEYRPKNVRLDQWMKKEDYEQAMASCDVGMIFLDHNFTIPNFPSRILSYMQAKLPILAVTDLNSDVGKVITDNGFGWWCESSSITGFIHKIDAVLESDLKAMGEAGYDYLNRNYNVNTVFQQIEQRM